MKISEDNSQTAKILYTQEIKGVMFFCFFEKPLCTMKTKEQTK